MVEFYKTLRIEIDLDEYADESHTSFDDLRDAVEEGGGFDVDVIYYYKAMEYLSSNDNSLKESLELAADLGYDISNVDSELLATLLYQKEVREEFEDLEDEIEAFFDDLDEEDSE